MKGIRKPIKGIPYPIHRPFRLHPRSLSQQFRSSPVHIFSANHIAIFRKTSVGHAFNSVWEKYEKDAVKVQSKHEKSVRKVQSKCGQCAGKARKVRRKCENSVDNTYFKEKIFDLQFLDYFTATSWL